MRKFNILLISSAVSLLIACSGESHDKNTDSASAPAATSASKGDFEKVFNEAEKAYNDAVDMGAAWRDTDAILKKARAAAAGNDVDKATKLAEQALTQSQLAMKQQKEQQNAGPHLF